MQKNMELQYSTEKIKWLIKQSKTAEPYSEDDEVFQYLDGTYDQQRMWATTAQRLLCSYFKKHPEDSIENYMENPETTKEATDEA